jgi:gamma-glutamylcyclotransferase (GGCT)/AIG2-like uncharacterized protein YtfP
MSRQRIAMPMVAGDAVSPRAGGGYRDQMTSDRLFVYGTLMRGFDHPIARLLAAHAEFLGEATCRGRLVLVKHYPGLLLSDAPSDLVHGEVFHLRAASELLRELDMYEACGDGFAEPTEYLRQLIEVRLADGAPTQAWTYVYNWPAAGLPHIASGRFMEH